MGFWTITLLTAANSSIAAIGLFLQIRSGQLNPGMAPFVGLGGYVSGSLCVNAGLAPWLSIPLGAVAGFCFGCLFAFITLRLHHWFFAITTVTFSVAAVSGVGYIDYFGGAGADQHSTAHKLGSDRGGLPAVLRDRLSPRPVEHRPADSRDGR